MACVNQKSSCVHAATHRVVWSAGFSDDEDLRPDFEDLSPAVAWNVVMETLLRHETPQHHHCLHLAAIRAALVKERCLKLPAALLAPFQVHLRTINCTKFCITAFVN